ncbi:MAG TPA: DUF2946 domain-containing protein [Burkholderiaceae bacterium]|jgi:hypothetical protein
MRLRQDRQRFTIWVAILAVLMMAFAPLMSQAFGAKSASGWAEICSVYGSKWVKIDAGTTDPQPTPVSGHPLDHCPYCSLHTNALGMPPPAPVILRAVATYQEVPPAFLLAPRTQHAWRSAQPRGPPFLA